MESLIENPLRLVVLGGAAGSLGAIRTVLSGLPAEPGFAVLVICQDAVDRAEDLDAVLRPVTCLQVQRLEHFQRTVHGRVYVMPPDRSVVAIDGHLKLVRREPGAHQPIDTCLDSIASDPDVQGAVVLFSGAGRDGADHLADLKSAGGLVLVQSPSSAPAPGMPEAAIATGLVDDVLVPEAMAERLVARFGDAGTVVADDPADDAEADALRAALTAVHQKTGVDLGFVKEVNLRRRFMRRLLLQRDRDLPGYLQLLRTDGCEAAALRDDILIGVTAFFRDADFVNVLKRVVIPRLLELQHDPIRVWVPACSTGEEVYTIALLLRDALGDDALHRRVQIFGTDINEGSIEVARAGRYSAAAVDDVPEAYRARGFAAVAGGYVVRKEIRDMCVFARHNLITHAPFSGMGLISCRNMLIYLRKAAQQHVLSVLHYACRPDGFVLLGRAEAASTTDGFEHAGAPHLYRRLPNARRQQGVFPAQPQRGWDSDGARPRRAQPLDLIMETVQRRVVERYGPSGFVVDAQGEVVQFCGDVTPFVAPAHGGASLSLHRLLTPELNVAVRTALIEAQRTNDVVHRERVPLEDRRYTLEVLPLAAPQLAPHYFVTFQPLLEGAPADGAGGPLTAEQHARVVDLERTVAMLSDELQHTQEQLKSVVMEFESANEQLRTANEEMLSTNEELQSANEELLIAKQEYESANQELETLNEELGSRNRQLDRANDDLSNLVDGIPLPVVLLDRHLRVRHYSPLAMGLFGFEANSVGRPIAEFGGQIAADALDRAVQAAVQGLSDQVHEYQDASGRWWLANVRAYRTGDDRIDGAVVSFQDIDTLKRALQEAQTAWHEAERANAAKDNFLALVSHELRAPLNVISSWASVVDVALARQGVDPELTPRAIKTILRNCQAQAQLIDDLLDVSRISSGRFTLDARPVDFAGVVRTVMEGQRPGAESKGVALIAAHLDESALVAGDARRLQQVVANLVANSIKFTPAGGHVEVTIAKLSEMVELTVRDNGIGIEASLLPKLFDPFMQADTTQTRKYGGLGLGLYIVRHLVSAHGGSVVAMSDGKGRGARLVVRVPALSDGVATDIDDEPSRADVSCEGLSVLTVDDDTQALEAMAALLRHEGAVVTTAASANEALERFDPRVINVVISDLAMPGTDGFSFIRALREKEVALHGGAEPHVYALALSGLASLHDRDAALAAGFDDHAAKPLHAEQLLKRLRLAHERMTLRGESSGAAATEA